MDQLKIPRRCPNCARTLKISSGLVGKKVKCCWCNSLFVVGSKHPYTSQQRDEDAPPLPRLAMLPMSVLREWWDNGEPEGNAYEYYKGDKRISAYEAQEGDGLKPGYRSVLTRKSLRTIVLGAYPDADDSQTSELIDRIRRID